ncbi:MAG TPA: TldD/PmbA family protein [Methanothermobacter sp.]|nr:zinc metalloproteinase [Methanothermobacter sp. MT-2]HHW05312.1 TldD/PmbA family protein [Methanothermobacter sp.]HOK72924.1 TldD/PmbA family protein [Methanothermobacter sp.]HOL68990.1 TldD/PmbA family protein [Methanothermobacter sp.]HPQ04873.1 TldD/PmbA family protein [Methanothermobacter sp.]
MDISAFEKTIHRLEGKADYTDIRFGESKINSLLMKDGKIQEIRTGHETGISIRVLNGGSWGLAYTSDPSKVDETAEKALRLSERVGGDAEIVSYPPIVDNISSKAKIPPSNVPSEDKKRTLLDIHKAATIDKIISTTINYIDIETKNIFLNSEGSSIESEEVRVALFLNTVASDGLQIQMGHDNIGGCHGYEIIEGEDLERLGRTTSEKAVRLLSAHAPPSGKFTILTDPKLTGVFIHEALGHATEADLILQDDSILKDRLGETIGSKHVKIIDNPTMDAFGHYNYDVEGVKASPTILVENGILKSYLTSRETAQKLGLEPTGNARSNISENPIVRMSNTYIEPGTWNFEEMIEDIKEGIYLKGSRGGQVDTGKGIFQFNAAESFMIKNGEIKEPLRDVSLSGNITETLKKVDAIGSDFKMNIGFCGKAGQIVPVGDGGPHLRVREVVVGGSG